MQFIFYYFYFFTFTLKIVYKKYNKISLTKRNIFYHFFAVSLRNRDLKIISLQERKLPISVLAYTFSKGECGWIRMGI